MNATPVRAQVRPRDGWRSPQRPIEDGSDADIPNRRRSFPLLDQFVDPGVDVDLDPVGIGEDRALGDADDVV
jgi:hypothetical protein